MKNQPAYLKSLKTETVVQRVVNSLTEGIISGELKPGDKLPTEPELSENFGVARTSVREAIKILAYMGVLESRRSEGTFVSSGYKESMIDPMIYGIILDRGEDFDSLMELRELIEVGILQLAVKKANEEDLEKLKQCLEQFEMAKSSAPDKLTEALFEADNRFHDTVAELCHNSLVVKIDAVVRMLTYATRHETVKMMAENQKSDELLAAHWQIYDMLKSRELNNMQERIRQTYFLEQLKISKDL